jgi:hypothetical protein
MTKKVRSIALLMACIIMCITTLIAQEQKIPEKDLLTELHELMDTYQYGQACQIADQLLCKDCLNIGLLILKGRALAADFKFQQAKEVFSTAYCLDTSNSVTLFELVNICRQLGDSKQAIVYCLKIVDLYPENSFFSTHLSNLYFATEDFISAKNILLTLYRKDSMNAYCHYLLKEYPVAAQKFSECVLLGDKSKFTLKYSGLSWYRQERYDLAEPLFRSAYQADTADIETCFYYGVSAYRSALPDTGVAYLEKTLRLLLPDPQFLKTVNTELAGAYTANGQADTALIILQSAYKTNPDYAILAFDIAYQYDYYLGKPFLALPYYNEFLKKCPGAEKREAERPQHRSYYEYASNRVKEIKGR